MAMLTEERVTAKTEGEIVWFAMSATFGRAMKAKSFLEGESVECFVPMRYVVVKDKLAGKRRNLVPAINNLIFVRTSKEVIQTLKARLAYLQYLVRPCNGRNIPIVVPDDQMQQFITICNTYNEKLRYLTPDDVDLQKGTRVKIVGGAFDGIEGTFVKVNGSRSKRVVVNISGVAAVATAEITDGLIQVVE